MGRAFSWRIQGPEAKAPESARQTDGRGRKVVQRDAKQRKAPGERSGEEPHRLPRCLACPTRRRLPAAGAPRCQRRRPRPPPAAAGRPPPPAPPEVPHSEVRKKALECDTRMPDAGRPRPAALRETRRGRNRQAGIQPDSPGWKIATDGQTDGPTNGQTNGYAAPKCRRPALPLSSPKQTRKTSKQTDKARWRNAKGPQ
jgi:hypothetical protein